MGYPVARAFDAILRTGCCFLPMDLVSNVTISAVKYLNGSPPPDGTPVFCTLSELQVSSLHSMLDALHQLRPHLTRIELMWCLYLSKLDLHRASTIQVPSFAVTASDDGGTGGGGEPTTAPMGDKTTIQHSANPPITTAPASSPTAAELNDSISPTPNPNPNPSGGINDSGWIYCTEEQIEDRLLGYIESVYLLALADLILMGFPEVRALDAILRTGRCFLPMDLVSNVTISAVKYLNGSPPPDVTPVLCTLRELQVSSFDSMLDTLHQLRPHLTRIELMWCLYLSKLDLYRASTIQVPSFAVTASDDGGTGGGGELSMKQDGSIMFSGSPSEGAVMEDLPDPDGMASLTGSVVESVSISEEKVAPEGHNEIETDDEAYKLSTLELEKHEKKEKLMDMEKLQEVINEIWRQFIQLQQQLMEVQETMKEIQMKSRQEIKAKDQVISQVHEEHRANEAAATVCIKIRDEALQLEMYRDSQRDKDNIQRLEEEPSRLKALSGSTSKTSVSGETDVSKPQASSQ